MLRLLLIGGLVLGLAAAAEAGPAKKAKKQKSVKGTVTAVDSGTVTVQTKTAKKDGGAGQTKDQKVSLGDKTKFVLVTGKKGSQEEKPATRADLQTGDHVVVQVGAGSAADKVVIHHKKKKKKA